MTAKPRPTSLTKEPTMSTKTARNGAKTDADKKPSFKTSIDIPKEARTKSTLR